MYIKWILQSSAQRSVHLVPPTHIQWAELICLICKLSNADM